MEVVKLAGLRSNTCYISCGAQPKRTSPHGHDQCSILALPYGGWTTWAWGRWFSSVPDPCSMRKVVGAGGGGAPWFGCNVRITFWAWRGRKGGVRPSMEPRLSHRHGDVRTPQGDAGQVRAAVSGRPHTLLRSKEAHRKVSGSALERWSKWSTWCCAVAPVEVGFCRFRSAARLAAMVDGAVVTIAVQVPGSGPLSAAVKGSHHWVMQGRGPIVPWSGPQHKATDRVSHISQSKLGQL